MEIKGIGAKEPSPVVLKLENRSKSPGECVKTPIAEFHLQSSWLNRSGLGPNNLHF